MSIKLKILVSIATALVIVGTARMVYERTMDRLFPVEYKEEIRKYAKEEGLSTELVMAVINTESGFDPKAHSGVAKGLMQITDGTAMWVSKKMGITYYYNMAYDPETNIKMGCWFLRYLKNRYENQNTALAAYNAGIGNVDKWLDDPACSEDGETLAHIPFEETENYVAKVNKMLEIYRQKAY